ncbi:MAG: hypothetical protein ACTSRC_21785 [Candidatus Helarchaeota archaeon]
MLHGNTHKATKRMPKPGNPRTPLQPPTPLSDTPKVTKTGKKRWPISTLQRRPVPTLHTSSLKTI